MKREKYIDWGSKDPLLRIYIPKVDPNTGDLLIGPYEQEGTSPLPPPPSPPTQRRPRTAPQRKNHGKDCYPIMDVTRTLPPKSRPSGYLRIVTGKHPRRVYPSLEECRRRHNELQTRPWVLRAKHVQSHIEAGCGADPTPVVEVTGTKVFVEFDEHGTIVRSSPKPDVLSSPGKDHTVVQLTPYFVKETQFCKVLPIIFETQNKDVRLKNIREVTEIDTTHQIFETQDLVMKMLVEMVGFPLGHISWSSVTDDSYRAHTVGLIRKGLQLEFMRMIRDNEKDYHAVPYSLSGHQVDIIIKRALFVCFELVKEIRTTNRLEFVEDRTSIRSQMNRL